MAKSPDHPSEGADSRMPAAPLRKERVIEALCEAYARDQIGTPELERRLDRANRVHTEAELRELLDDLDLSFLEGPPPVPAGTEGPASGEVGRETRRSGTSGTGTQPVARSEAGVSRVDRSQVPDRQLSVGIWSGRVRKGSWIPARSMTAMAVMGGVELDFREALLGPDPVELRAMAVMGGIHVIVPPELRVETSGFAIMGGFEDHSELTAGGHTDTPTLRVTGLALMGGVEIEVRRVGESVRDAKRRRKREGRG